MIPVHNIDDSSFNSSQHPIEIHQSISSSPYIGDDLTNSSSYYAEKRFSEQSSTSTTLQSPINRKTENLYRRKMQLLEDKSKLLNSFSFKFFNVGQKRILTIDRELDKIEKEIISIKNSGFKNDILQTKEVLRKTKANILKYKTEIQKTENGSFKA